MSAGCRLFRTVMDSGGRWRSWRSRRRSCSGCSNAPAFSNTSGRRGRALSDDLALLEAQRDFALGVGGAVGAVHGVALEIDGEVLADGAGRRIDRIGCAHHRAVLGDGVFAL